MTSSAGPRRLRLASAASARIEPLVSRVPVPEPAVAVADWVPEAGALEFATWLAEALAPELRPLIVVCAFERAPELPREALVRLERAASSLLVCAVEPSEAGARALLETAREAPGSRLWLFVGEPAVAALEAPLGVLVGVVGQGENALPSLRPVRDATTLCLAEPRRPLAAALARELLRTLSA